MVSYKILIVEDDVILASVLKDFFEENDFEVIHVISGEEAVEIYEKKRPSIVLLDIVLPGINGFEVIEEMQKTDNSIPVIMMTGTEYDVDSQIRGYNFGAINYTQKPVLPQVLLAQINKLLNSPEMKKYRLNGYSIIIRNPELRINDAVYTLKERDIQLLSVLFRRPNEIISRKDLLLAVWKDDDIRLNNHLDSSISRIKKVLMNHPGVKIKRVYGVGYGISI